MKLLVVSHSCATSANCRLYREIQALSGWDTTLVVPARWRDEFGNILDQSDPRDFQGRLLRVPVAFNGNIILHTYLKRWRAFLTRERFDAIYVNHEPYGVATARICLAARGLSTAFGFYSCQNIAKSYPFPFSAMERMVFQRSDFAFPVTAAVSDVLRQKGYQKDFTLVPLPVDLDFYFPRPESENHALLPRDPGQVVLGYVGRIVESKGLRTLALALSRLKDLSWKLSVVGSGAYETEFSSLLSQQGIRDRVTFHGYIPHDETPKYLSAFDTLVLPSETTPSWKEQFGRVIPEALACGTSVVGSDSGEIPTLIRASAGGAIFPERDDQALASVLRTTITDPEKRRRASTAGRTWVHNHLSLPSVAALMAGSIQRAVESRKNYALTHP